MAETVEEAEVKTIAVAKVEEKKPEVSTAIATAKNTDEMPLKDAANVLKVSGLVKPTETIGQVLAKLSLGRNLGLPDIAALSGLNITDKGQILVAASILQLLIKASNKYKLRVLQRDDKGSMIEVYELDQHENKWEKCGVPVFFGIKDAERAGLASKDNYKKWPIDMYYARCLAAAFRTYCADCMRGVAMYLPDEIDNSKYRTEVTTGGMVEEADYDVKTERKVLSGDKLGKIRVLMKETNSEEAVWLEHFGVGGLENLTDKQIKELEDLLKKKKKVVK